MLPDSIWSQAATGTCNEPSLFTVSILSLYLSKVVPLSLFHLRYYSMIIVFYFPLRLPLSLFHLSSPVLPLAARDRSNTLTVPEPLEKRKRTVTN